MDLIERDVVEETLDSNESPSEEELADFRGKVSEWMKMDDQIRKLEIAIRERKVHQRALSEGIQTFMDKYGYDNLNTNQGRIRHSCRIVKLPVKMTEVKEKLLEYKELTGEELFKKIFESERPTKENKKIRRIIPKVSMNLDL